MPFTSNSLDSMCSVKSGNVLQCVFWLLFFSLLEFVFPLCCNTSFPHSWKSKVMDFYFLKGDYATEQIYLLSYREQLLNSCYVIREPGVSLIIVIMFAAANLTYLCISPGQ